MPVIIETNVDTIASGRLGAATNPVSGPGLQGFPQHRFMLYPGVYHVTGIDSLWIRAVRDVAVDDNRTHYLSDTSPTAQVWYEPTAAPVGPGAIRCRQPGPGARRPVPAWPLGSGAGFTMVTILTRPSTWVARVHARPRHTKAISAWRPPTT